MHRPLSHSPFLVLLLATALAAACSAPEPPAAETAPAERPSAAASPDDAGLPALDMPNAGQPLEGVVTGGQPTQEDLEKLAARGFATVVNLRPEGENGTSGERATVEALGLRYVSLPIAGAEDLTEANALALDALLDDTALRPMLLHCGSSNRVGALVALAAFHGDGLSADEALDRGMAAGLSRLEDAVRERMAQADTPVEPPRN